MAVTITDHSLGGTLPKRTVRAGKLGKLEIVREMASGAAGDVFEARDAKTDMRYVVKTLREQTRAPIDLIRFSREASLMARFRHPNVMPILHVATTNDPPYYVMPLRGGVSLQSKLMNGPLSVSLAMRVARDICYGLADVHRLGVVHRDIKPANVLVESDGRVVLIDFGLAKVSGPEGSVTAPGSLLGTPGYMSPEQCLGEPVTDRSDVYSLGVMLYELITGTNPFIASNLLQTINQQISFMPRRLDAMLPGKVSAELGELVHRMIAKRPTQRPKAETCLEVFAGLVRQDDRKTRRFKPAELQQAVASK